MEARSKVKREGKYEYTDKLSQRTCTFKAVDDEIVATFNQETSDDVAATLLSREDSAVSQLSPQDGFAILRVGDETATLSTMDSLEEGPNIANVIPVMMDEDGGRRYFIPDEFTVQFAEKIQEKKAQEILSERGMNIVTKQRTDGYYTISVPEGKGLFQSIGELSKLKEVVFAEPSEVGVDDLLGSSIKNRGKGEYTENSLKEEGLQIDKLFEEDVEDTSWDNETGDLTEDGLESEPEAMEIEGESDLLALPSDAAFGRLWGLHNTGQLVNGSTGSFDADIDAPQAWNITAGKKNVVVAVIDTGCDLDHPDLESNILPRGNEDWDFAASDSVPWDSGTHGTHVAGTVAARRNTKGVVGVAPSVWVMPLRVNLTSGKNQNRADAINYVAKQALKYKNSRRYVINCSWKMSGHHSGVLFAIRNAIAKNVVVVFAAGNANSNIDVSPQYPAIYPEVIAVAATDQRDERASFSNYGKKVDVAAPGVNIYSTIPNDTYGYKNGTSMASPHVAGLAALIWSKNLGLSNSQVRKCIENTCDNIDSKNPAYSGLLGKGRINAYRALLHTPPPKLKATLYRKFKFPQKNAGSSTGLTFIPQFPLPFWGRRPVVVFLTQKAGSERIYFLDHLNGAVRRSIDPASNNTIGSLAWDGSAVRAANVTIGAGSINRINIFNGSQIGSIPAPTGRGEGLVVVGSRIFYSTISQIHMLQASTGQVLRSFPAPGGPCRGLTYGRGFLFSANSTTGKITVFNPWTLQIRGVIDAPGGGTRQAEGIAFDSLRRILYVANQSENQIYALRISGI